MQASRDRVRAIAEIESSAPQAADAELLGRQIETLFGPLRSLFIGLACGVFVGIVVTVRTGSAALALMVGLMIVAAAARTVVTLLFRVDRADHRARDRMRLWERRYLIGAWSHAASQGALLFTTLVVSGDAIDHLLVTAYVCGYASGVAARNAGSPRIAIGQLALIFGPGIVGALLGMTAAYAVLAVLMAFYLAAAIEIVRYLNADILRLLRLNGERGALADALAIQNGRFNAALSNMSHGLCMFDAEGRLIVANDRFFTLFGLTAERVCGATVREIVGLTGMLLDTAGTSHEELARGFETRLASRQPSASIIHLADGLVIALSQQPIDDGGNVVIMEDVTERQRTEARVAHMASHDALTDLPNRTLFRERLNEQLARIRQDGGGFGVLSLDLDRFKTVNDSAGHPAGDAVLCAVAVRIRDALGEFDMVARLGGDEFVVLTVDGSSVAVSELGQRLIARLSEPYELDGQTVEIGVSIGVALAPADGATAEDLLKTSDLALYRAKADGRGVMRFFAREMDQAIQARHGLERDLRRALDGDEFVLHYQPQVDLVSGRIVGVEALIRWNHPARGFVSPADFIPLAEELGLIVPIGAWVIRQACLDAAAWPGDIRVAVNLSPIQFRGGGLVETVMNALAGSGLDARRLEIEITESMLLERTEETLAALHRLRNLGIRVAMDDFGIGYSSLAYLRAFPFDKIKIDRSFVREMDTNADCAAIVRAVAGLGLSLGIATTAEGVETREQHDLVRQHGCTEMQGYYFSRPRPVSEIAVMLDAQAEGMKSAA